MTDHLIEIKKPLTRAERRLEARKNLKILCRSGSVPIKKMKRATRGLSLNGKMQAILDAK